MIFGTEEPALFPVKDLYDTGMIQNYINSVQREYERGIAEQKEFQKNFGDFFSPIAKDMESWNNLTMKPIQNAINFMQQNGIDPVRSAEGRALLSKLVNNVNYGDLARLRQSAKTAEQYRSIAEKLKAEGKFSPELEAMIGNGDLSTWDTLKDGTWSAESPTAMKSLYDLTHDRFDPLAKQSFDLGPGKDRYHRRKGVDESHMRPVAQTALDGIKNTPYYKYYKSVYGDDKAIEDAMINANKAVMHDDQVVDQGLFNAEKLRIDRAQLGISQYNAETARLKAMMDAGYVQNPNTGRWEKPVTAANTTPADIYQETDVASKNKREIYLGGGSNGGSPSNFEKRIKEVISYWDNLASDKHAYKNKGYAKKVADHYRRIKKGGLEAAIKGGYFKSNEYGDIIPTSAWERVVTKVETNNVVTKPIYNEALSKAVDRRNTYKVNPSDKAAKNADAFKFTGTSVVSNNITAGDGIKNREVHLGVEDMVFTPHRALTVSGKTQFRDVDQNIAELFDAFVHKNQIIGRYTNSSYSRTQKVSYPRSEGGRSYEIDAPILIEKKDIESFAKKWLGKNQVTPDQYEDVIDALGVTPVDMYGRNIDKKGNLNWKHVEYVEAPFTRVENNNNNLNAGQFATQVDKDRYGQKLAGDLAVTRQTHSLARR